MRSNRHDHRLQKHDAGGCSRMRAIQVTGYGAFEENLSLRQVDVPTPGEGEVLVRVHAAAINPHDCRVVEGLFKAMEPLDFPAGVGSDFAGTVESVGQGVPNVSAGDAVYGMGHGSLADYCVVNAGTLAEKPSGLSFVEAASLPLVATTTIQAFERIGGIGPGASILIHAASGGVGSFAVQHAKHAGAEVYATTSASNKAWVTELGADVVIDYRNEDYREVCSSLDVVFDTLGGEHTFDAFALLRPGGKVVAILPSEVIPKVARELGIPEPPGVMVGSEPSRIDQLCRRHAATYEFVFAKPAADPLVEVSRLVESGKVVPVIEQVLGVDQVIDAFVHVAGGHAKGKTVISLVDEN